MAFNVTNTNYDTVKSGVIDENVRSKITDFNLEKDNSDDHLSLEIDIIKDLASDPWLMIK